MAKLKRENHFLPVCYQKGFTDSSEKVWIKFADKPEPEHRNPESVGRLRNLYIRKQNGRENDHVEEFFERKVESAFAILSRRIKNERNRFSEISGAEEGTICSFVASQAVRTLAHKQCVEEQTGGPVDANTFARVMGRQMWAIVDFWRKNLPAVCFYTSLPYVGEHFITGDSPVLVAQMNDNLIWEPVASSDLRTTDLPDILNSARYGFSISLSPYVYVCIGGRDSGEARLPPVSLDPQRVRSFNDLIRGQSSRFVLARDRESLL